MISRPIIRRMHIEAFEDSFRKPHQVVLFRFRRQLG